MKNRIWIIIFSAAALLCAAAWFFVSSFSSPTKIVGIYQNGSLVEKIDLNSVTEERKIVLSGEHGKNTVIASRGRIKMDSADCPDKICVKHGELESGGAPIVCLPNKVVIKFENVSDGADARTGAAG